VESSADLATHVADCPPAETLIWEAANLKLPVRFERAQILIEVVVESEDAECAHGPIRFFGSMNPIRAPRSSAVVAKRTIPTT
jgi:hypothetical protein